MSKQSPRQAAQERVSAYHEDRLGELIGHVRETLEGFDAGDLDAFEADQAISSTAALRRSCGSSAT